MFSKNQTIKKRVLAVIEARIQSAQKEYDEEVDALDEKLVRDLEALRMKRLSDVEAVATRLVDRVIGISSK